ncbi:portal protein [Bacillus phage Pascal]|uniref:Head-to-tail joining protein n=1 Tax=Bacillus phage Pascal TaxID=1540092 RepID=A0A0A0RPT2_9CAUD|nr:portal protein [Bacillus phage Pascal]AIW03639.1 head-to-tail joining protein [Bacillus phage Pascal]
MAKEQQQAQGNIAPNTVMQPEMIEQIKMRAEAVEKEYKQALDYKRSQNFLTNWATFERFKAGDQWPAVTERTKMLPRPVFNIIDQIVSHKVATIMNENIKMVYSAMDVDEPDNEREEETSEEMQGEDITQWEGADQFSRYSESVWEHIKQDQLNEEMLENAAAVGAGFIHYYWDPSVNGGNKLKYNGDIKGEVIDAVNIFFGNPQIPDIQKQPYIIITSREFAKTVQEAAATNGLPPEFIEQIKEDKETQDQAYDMAQQEQDGKGKVTVLTRYYKKNGEVHFIKTAAGITIKDETPMGFDRYPIVMMNWKRRKKSIFGVGDIESLIPNQKAINFLMAMQLLSAQLTGWPKVIVNRSYIKQRIKNEPGEIIYTDAPPDKPNAGIDYLNPASMPSHLPELVDNFVGYTKETSGANENAMGENNSSDLNATAIIQLQKAAGVPLESIKRRFYQAMEDTGLIWMQFFKTKYNTLRMIKLQNDEGEEYHQEFQGTDYADVDMRCKIDIGPSSSYSETLMMSSLDKFLDMQLIDFETYLELVPKNVVPFKDRLKRIVKQKQQEAAQMADQQFEELLNQMDPAEQEAYYSAPPQLQAQMKAQIMGGQEGQPPGAAPPMGAMPQGAPAPGGQPPMPPQGEPQPIGG